jgi:hypothetical protein
MPILVPKLLSLYRTLSFTVFGLLLLRIFGANINAFHIIPSIMKSLHRLIHINYIAFNLSDETIDHQSWTGLIAL